MEQEDLLLLIRDHLLEMKVQLQLQLQLFTSENKDHLYEMSTPTNKLATYFGDDKPTSRSVFIGW